MKTHKLLYIICFICILFTFKMCTDVENVEYDLLLEQKDNIDLLDEIRMYKHDTYKYKKQYDSINKLYQKVIYVKPVIKKTYTKPTIKDTIVPIIEIKDTL